VVTDGSEVLNVCSRISFRKTYTVEHNVKVLSIGVIAPEHNHLLRNYWRLAHDRYERRPAPSPSPLPAPSVAGGSLGAASLPRAAGGAIIGVGAGVGGVAVGVVGTIIYAAVAVDSATGL